MSVDASVSRWLKVRGVAGAMVRLAPPALGSGTGLSVPAALPAAVVDDTHLQANPSARLQTQLNDVRQRVMLLESELDITQQDATTFRSAFEGGEQELKAAQDAKVDALTLVAGESLGLALIFFVALLSWLMMSFPVLGRLGGDCTPTRRGGGAGAAGPRQATSHPWPPPRRRQQHRDGSATGADDDA